MMSNPRIGASAQVWYSKRVAPFMPLHGRTGKIVVRGGCRPTARVRQVCTETRHQGPRNHGIEIDGQLYVVPCGNLREVKMTPKEQHAIIAICLNRLEKELNDFYKFSGQNKEIARVAREVNEARSALGSLTMLAEGKTDKFVAQSTLFDTAEYQPKKKMTSY